MISSCTATASPHTLPRFSLRSWQVRRCLLVELHERAGLVEDQQSKALTQSTQIRWSTAFAVDHRFCSHEGMVTHWLTYKFHNVGQNRTRATLLCRISSTSGVVRTRLLYVFSHWVSESHNVLPSTSVLLHHNPADSLQTDKGVNKATAPQRA